MRNNVGIYKLFGDNKKVKILFADWCKKNEELCEYDLEHILIDLEMPCINNTDRYFHFHKGNILDFLEKNGYYIGLPLRGEFKFVTCCYFKGEKSKNVGMPFYNNSGIKDRNIALEKGIQKCIEHLEKNL